jgi:hypothetical protein
MHNAHPNSIEIAAHPLAALPVLPGVDRSPHEAVSMLRCEAVLAALVLFLMLMNRIRA